MGNPETSPVPGRRARGRPRTTDIDWNDPEQVAAYNHGRSRLRKQARQQRDAAESDNDIVSGGDACAELWNLKPNQFYHRARIGLPGVVKVANSWAASRK